MMIEFALMWLATPYILIALIFTSLLFEYNEYHRTSSLLVGIALFSTYLIFTPPWQYYVAYIPVGIVWSFWRWRIHCSKSADLARKGDRSRSWLESRVDLRVNINRVTSWIIVWPVSVLERTLHDVIHYIKVLITEYLIDVYKRYSNRALSDYDKGSK